MSDPVPSAKAQSVNILVILNTCLGRWLRHNLTHLKHSQCHVGLITGRYWLANRHCSPSAKLSKRLPLFENAHSDKCKRTASSVVFTPGEWLTCFRVQLNSPRSCARRDTSSIR